MEAIFSPTFSILDSELTSVVFLNKGRTEVVLQDSTTNVELDKGHTKIKLDDKGITEIKIKRKN